MGSFASTCCISGLPIEAGDAVRYLLLTQNPSCDGGFVSDSHGRWAPRTWPIKARYNDYGSIEKWEEGPIQELIMKGFQGDLVEVGVGDNSVHDVAAKKDMSFEDLLEAVWEGRVKVYQNPWTQNPKNLVKIPEHLIPEVPKWIPNIRNVETILSEIQIKEHDRYLVDDLGGSVRVRWNGRSGDYDKDEERLLEAKALLEKTFAVALTAGSGDYARPMELLCFMAPGKNEQGHDRHIYSKREEPTLLIQQAMVREDVWQALLKLKVSSNWSRSKDSLDKYRDSVTRFLKKVQAQKEKRLKSSTAVSTIEELLLHWDLENIAREEIFAFLLAKDMIPSSIGLATHSRMLINSGHADEDFAALAAEFSFIWKILMNVRYVWRPSDTSGPQFGEYKIHLSFLRALSKTCLEAKKIRDSW